MTAVTTSDVAAALTLTLSLDRGCRFSLFSAKPCMPMLNFLLARAPRSRKSTASGQAEGSEMNTEKESKNSRTRRMTAYPYKIFAGHNTSGQIPKGKQGSPLDISLRTFGGDVIGLPDRQ